MASDKCTQHGLRDNDGYAVATPRAALHHCTYAQHATYEMPPGYPRGSQSTGDECVFVVLATAAARG